VCGYAGARAHTHTSTTTDDGSNGAQTARLEIWELT